MLNYTQVLIDGGILAVIMSIYLIALLMYNPRLFLNEGDYPPDVIAAVPPKTPQEQRLAIWFGIPFLLLSFLGPLYSTYNAAHQTNGSNFWLLFAHAFGVLLIPFFVDLILLDWLMFCTITPSFVVIPGTEGFAGYKDYMFHLRAHSRGIFILIGVGLLTAALTLWII